MADEVVVDSDKKALVATLVDEKDNPINLTGAAAVPRLQGKSDDLGTPTIDYAGVITDAAQGKVTFSAIGLLVTTAQLGSLKRATYILRVKYTDAAGKFDYTPTFNIAWVVKPV